MPAKLNDALTLPCGAVLKNRIAKSAMTEGIANPEDNRANERHVTLYRRWAQGGAGLLLTGNVQVDRRFLERPGNVAADDNGGRDELGAYARAARENDTHAWMQINHPGRQAGTGTERFVSPSENTKPGREGTARALEADEIEDIIARFIKVARTAQETGFTGVQVHSAHGYLMSQFLSPLTNRRDDKWGGSLENRARALLTITRGIRAAVGKDFPVSVKLNSADFQKGGLTEDESIQVTRWLIEAGIDLLEISGGNYESQMMVGREEDLQHVKITKAASTIAREAYFLDFAKRLRPLVTVPLMVTGGFRTRTVMQEALANGELDVIGLARPLCLDPDIPNRLLNGTLEQLPSPDDFIDIDPADLDDPSDQNVRVTAVAAGIAYYFNQVRKLAAGENAETEQNWLDQLRQHTDFDAAAERRYLARD